MTLKLVRLAKPEDAKHLAELHWTCAVNQPDGFMFRLGKGFLRQYYRVFLNEKKSVILCAENENGDIIGLVSGSLATEEHMAAMRRSKLSLGFSALPAIARSPSLFAKMRARHAEGSADQDSGGFVVTSGAREEYLAWDPKGGAASGAIELHRKWLSLMRILGAVRIRGEVDRMNSRIEKMHKLMGASVIKEFSTPDGRKRIIIEYVLDESAAPQQRAV